MTAPADHPFVRSIHHPLCAHPLPPTAVRPDTPRLCYRPAADHAEARDPLALALQANYNRAKVRNDGREPDPLHLDYQAEVTGLREKAESQRELAADLSDRLTEALRSERLLPALIADVRDRLDALAGRTPWTPGDPPRPPEGDVMGRARRANGGRGETDAPAGRFEQAARNARRRDDEPVVTYPGDPSVPPGVTILSHEEYLARLGNKPRSRGER